MNRFKEELRVIPRAGWWIAAGLYAAMAIFLGTLSKGESNLPAWGAAAITFFMPISLSSFALLVAYVNGDARRRAMRHVMWTLLAIFIPYGIGVILYFILRHPLATPCTKCGKLSPSSFAFCTACGATLKGACPQCRRQIEPEWSNCAFCGVKL
jgi:hypothetical protein